MVASMVRSLRRWAQVTMATLAITAVASVVVLCVPRRQPEASSAAAVHETLQLQAASPTLALQPMVTLPPTTPLTTLAPLVLSDSTTKATSNIEDDDAPVPGEQFHRLLRFIALTVCMIYIVCIQLCCYLRSGHEPADIEEGLQADPQTVQADLWGPSLLLTQVMKFIELCGFEARSAFVSGTGNFYIDERSDCAQRCFTSVNRELTLFGHAGPSGEAPVTLRMFKPYHLQCCCFCRPKMHIDMPTGDNNKMVDVGTIEDPCSCCEMSQMLFDSNEELRYEVTGPRCQWGAYCPCCSDVKFDINDESGATVGAITKKRLTFKECCTKTNRFKIDFPEQCTMDDKRLLVGSTMLLDLQYFEKNLTQD